MLAFNRNCLSCFAFAVIFSVTVCVHAAQLFYEDFEDPVVDNTVETVPIGWVSVTGSDAGLSDTPVTGKTGDQYGWVFRDGGALLISDIGHTLGVGTNYTLTCDLTFSRGDPAFATVALLAGGNVIAISTNVNQSVNDFTGQSVTLSFVAVSGHPNIGEPLGIRLRGDYWQAYFDELVLDAMDTSTDTNPPTPTNMVWSSLPTSSVSNSITMQALEVSDMNTVQYFFQNTVSGNNSGWQDSPLWTDTGLEPKESYSYRFKARDKSLNLNETSWSSEESAECEEHIVLYESFERPSIRPNGNLGFSSANWFLPVEGWFGSTDNYQQMLHDVGSTFPTTTPFGEQFIAMRAEYVETTGAHELSGHLLQPEYTYRVTCNVGGAGERAGEENGVSTTSILQLYAGTNLLAGATNGVTLDDFSETNSLVFIPESEHPHLGEPLKVRLAETGGNWWYFAIYDNVKVYAIPPPPKGTVILLY